MSEETAIYVGRKPPTSYVMAIVTGFNVSNAKQIVLKGERGRAISTAVDAAEIARRRFLKDVEINKIEIGSEDIKVKEENRTRTVSTIEIMLKRSS